MSAHYQNTVFYSYNSQVYCGPYSVVSVYTSGTQNLVPLFSDQGLSSSVPNPITSDQNGYFSFWVDDGVYDLQAVFKSGNVSITSTTLSVPIGNQNNFYQLNETSTVYTSTKYFYNSKGIVFYDPSTGHYYSAELDNSSLGFRDLGTTLSL